MYNPDSGDDIHEDFRMSEYDDHSDNDNKDHIPRAKGQPIKNTRKNKPSSLTVKTSTLKETHTKKINKEDNDETMDTSYNKDKDKYEEINLDSEPSNPDPPNNGQLIDSDDETDTTEKLMEYYHKAKIDHNNPNFHMIQRIVKEELITLCASINLFDKFKLPY